MKKRKNIEKQSEMGEAPGVKGMEHRTSGKYSPEVSEQSSEPALTNSQVGAECYWFKVQSSKFKVQRVEFLTRFVANGSRITLCPSTDGYLPQRRRMENWTGFLAQSLTLTACGYSKEISTVNHSKLPEWGFLPMSYFPVRKKNRTKDIHFFNELAMRIC